MRRQNTNKYLIYPMSITADIYVINIIKSMISFFEFFFFFRIYITLNNILFYFIKSYKHLRVQQYHNLF